MALRVTLSTATPPGGAYSWNVIGSSPGASFGPTELAMKHPTAVALKGRQDARPYKESSAIVAASFQLAMIASRVGMSLGASESDERVEGSPQVEYRGTLRESRL